MLVRQKRRHHQYTENCGVSPTERLDWLFKTLGMGSFTLYNPFPRGNVFLFASFLLIHAQNLGKGK
jgi:hypothetical protein